MFGDNGGMPLRALLAATMLIVATAHAFVLPPGTYPFRTYGVQEGLGNLSALRIRQDSLGFLWVATQEGFYRYDGSRYRRYGLEEGLPSTFIATFATGPNGEVWVATGAGAVRWDGTRFHLIQSLPRTGLNALAASGDGRVWVATQEGLFTGSGDAFTRVVSWDGPATAVWFDEKSRDVWVGATGVIARLASADRYLVTPRERIDAIVIDARERVWARSGNHLWSLRRDGGDLRDESAALPATSNNGYLALDAHGNLWVPTDRGLAINDGAGWRVLGSAEGLPTDWARDVFEDREGSIWVASLGVHRMLGRGELVSYKRALPSEVTWCFRWDRDQHLLVGTDLGLARSTPTGWTVVEGTERAQIRTVVEEANGVLWAAGSPPEVIRIDGKNVRRYGEGEGVRGRAILRLLRDRQGSIWAATRGGGLLVMRAGEERFARVEVPGGNAEEDFRDVIEDRQGRIWASGQHGLARLANGRWSRFTRRHGLRHDHVSYLMQTAAGDLWLAYFEPLGIDRLDIRGDAIRVVEHLDTSRGLAANKIYILGEDDRRRLWIGTGAGIDVLARGAVEHFSTLDGLVGDDMDAMAFLCDQRGHVFIGTSSGFSHYVPRADPLRRAAPVVTLTQTTLGDAALTDNASLPANRQNLDFAAAFSALSYFKPDIVEYEVRLAGLDDAFRRVSEPRAHWSRIPPGRYRFEVRARLRPGPWSEPVGMAFAIRPSWWQTTWARGAAIALLLALAWLAYRWRVAWLRRRNIELEALVEQRTRELADLSVTDALTGMKNRRWLKVRMAGLTRETLSGRALICFMLDLDHFKDINDRHGHLVGDEVLVALGELLGGEIGEDATLVRWGGEELLYLARAPRHEAGAIAERIRAVVEGHDFRGIRLTCSIGFAAYPFLPMDPRRVSWQEVLDIADICLYAAKRAGRNCWIGVAAHDVRAPETLVARMRTSFEAVIASGEVTLESSAPRNGGERVARSAG